VIFRFGRIRTSAVELARAFTVSLNSLSRPSVSSGRHGGGSRWPPLERYENCDQGKVSTSKAFSLASRCMAAERTACRSFAYSSYRRDISFSHTSNAQGQVYNVYIPFPSSSLSLIHIGTALTDSTTVRTRGCDDAYPLEHFHVQQVLVAGYQILLRCFYGTGQYGAVPGQT